LKKVAVAIAIITAWVPAKTLLAVAKFPIVFEVSHVCSFYLIFLFSLKGKKERK